MIPSGTIANVVFSGGFCKLAEDVRFEQTHILVTAVRPGVDKVKCVRNMLNIREGDVVPGVRVARGRSRCGLLKHRACHRAFVVRCVDSANLVIIVGIRSEPLLIPKTSA